MPPRQAAGGRALRVQQAQQRTSLSLRLGFAAILALLLLLTLSSFRSGKPASSGGHAASSRAHTQGRQKGRLGLDGAARAWVAGADAKVRELAEGNEGAADAAEDAEHGLLLARAATDSSGGGAEGDGGGGGGSVSGAVLGGSAQASSVGAQQLASDGGPTAGQVSRAGQAGGKVEAVGQLVDGHASAQYLDGSRFAVGGTTDGEGAAQVLGAVAKGAAAGQAGGELWSEAAVAAAEASMLAAQPAMAVPVAAAAQAVGSAAVSAKPKIGSHRTEQRQSHKQVNVLPQVAGAGQVQGVDVGASTASGSPLLGRVEMQQPQQPQQQQLLVPEVQQQAGKAGSAASAAQVPAILGASGGGSSLAAAAPAGSPPRRKRPKKKKRKSKCKRTAQQLGAAPAAAQVSIQAAAPDSAGQSASAGSDAALPLQQADLGAGPAAAAAMAVAPAATQKQQTKASSAARLVANSAGVAARLEEGLPAAAGGPVTASADTRAAQPLPAEALLGAAAAGPQQQLPAGMQQQQQTGATAQRGGAPRLRPRVDAATLPNPNYVAICLAVKDQHEDIEEWVLHHRGLGVGRIYVWDNGSRPPMNASMAPHIASGFVHYEYLEAFEHETGLPQMYAYDACLERWRDAHAWMAFIDADEFILIMDATPHLPALLQDYEGHGGLVANWVMFGSNGRQKRPQGGTLRSYWACMPWNCSHNHHVKTIVQTKWAEVADGPHHFNYTEGRFAVNEWWQRVDGAISEVATTDRISVHHYVIKSLEEYEAKRRRGSGMRHRKSESFWRSITRQAKANCTAAWDLGYVEPPAGFQADPGGATIVV